MNATEALTRRALDALLRGAPEMQPGETVETNDGSVRVTADDIAAAVARATEIASRG